MLRRLDLRGWTVGLMLVGALSLLACEDESLNARERQEIERVLRTGTGFSDDPFVRAETLRVLESLADPAFDELAIGALEDKEPMVRIIALRALLATKHPDLLRHSLRRWHEGNEQERAAILDAVKHYGDEKLQLEIAQLATRSTDETLRLEGFELVAIAPVDKAKAEGKDDELRRTMLPQLGTYINKKDDVIAARALKKLIEFEGDVRAEPYLATLADEKADDKERIYAARLLRLAGVKRAVEPFEAILARAAEPIGQKLGLPTKVIDEQLVRAAVLGLVALGGDDEMIRRAQQYMTGATTEQVLEVLSTLAQNKSTEATISLKIAMQDSRRRVRLRAIELYTTREDAQAQALLSALNQNDFAAKRHIARALITRFPEEWSQDLKFQIESEDRVDMTLKLLRDVIIKDEDAVVLKPLTEALLARSKEAPSKTENKAKQGAPKEADASQRAAMASYLLLRADPQNATYLELLEQQREVHTRYVLLEHMMRHRPAQAVPTFRRYLYDDLYALRLMSAAGLWRAFNQQKTTQGSPQAKPAPEPES